MWLNRRRFGVWCLAVVAVLTASAAGNRYFPGTLTFDDPAVADELIFRYTSLQHPAEDGVLVTDQTAPITFVRLLTSDVAFGIDTAGILRNRSKFPRRRASRIST
jgi:hypothetical protein